MKKFILVAAERPNFMKVAPLLRAIEKHNGMGPLGYLDVVNRQTSRILIGKSKKAKIPALCEGKTAGRIIKIPVKSTTQKHPRTQ